MAISQNERHSKQLEQILECANNFHKGKKLSRFKQFIEWYFQDLAPEDIREREALELCAIAANHWKLAQQRPQDEIKIDVFHASKDSHGWEAERSYLQLVLPDRPFNVDSVALVLERLGYNINLTIHPRFTVSRNEQDILKDFYIDDLTQLPENNSNLQHESFVFIEFGPELEQDKLDTIEKNICTAMQDLRFAVTDWHAMRDAMQDVVSSDHPVASSLKKEDAEEAKRFLQWLIDDHFIFLGYREYKLIENNGLIELKANAKSGLGILRKQNSPKSYQTPINSEEAQKQIRQRGMLILTKANSRSNIHRDSHLDYIGIKVYGKDGKVVGEKRFLGLYSSVAYNRSPRYIPLLRQKVDKVIQMSGIRPRSHVGKALLHILENYPRDELMQSTVRELLDNTLGLVQLQERRRVKLFVRRDAFRRFFSFQIYVPRDYYNTQVREKIETILKAAVKGNKVESDVHISTSSLARVYCVIWTPSNEKIVFHRKAVEQKIREAARPYEEAVMVELSKRMELAQAEALIYRYANSFPNAYREDVSVYEASHDIERLHTLKNDLHDIKLSLYRPVNFPASSLRFKIFHYEYPIPLSDALPMLENMGFRAISERPYQLRLKDDAYIWIQDIELVHKHGDEVNTGALREAFHKTFAAIWRGHAENDRLNSLVTDAGLEWREVSVIRAYLRYLRQTSLPYSSLYMMQVLLEHPEYVRQLYRLFAMQFDPAIDKGKRSKLVGSAQREVIRELNLVTSLDKDRILRAFFDVQKATLRTSFFQTNEQGDHKSYISFKLDPRKIPELPLPLPRYEIWVYSPHVEGVHLRGGSIARGGLRWSDRPEDFRTEVLGLMKAQMVKNSVIVPVGAKGGFVVRNPVSGDRERMFEQGRECYKDFIRGLLDISDNYSEDKVIAPPNVIRKDPDDPYLVVAADKGTATFSDTANEVAAEYDFWLSDAFASGGSVGYDHKKMGITARGAWESVKRHFLELGKDIQSQEFTVAGIGDMAGDVFGNGMLLSPHIRLLAAFNHIHIFLDPDPDIEKSFNERQRLFDLPRSSWTDYDKKLISKGGGVFSRTAKEIPLSPQIQAMLDLAKDKASPTEVIQAILKSRVELLWNGGIGTYVKATQESHTEVGDRANDSVRVNASELQCKVIGEGGNLGFTHKSRIEFALNGGHISTDFIDNAGGVDCSDHEVNIKILLNQVINAGELGEEKRNSILAKMTSDVANLVLRNNYLQSLALSVLESRSIERTDEYMRVIRDLEQRGLLNREIEFLPNEIEIDERLKNNKKGLTRAEIATILSYSKIDLYNELLASDLVDEDYAQHELRGYFPKILKEKYSDLMPKHRLGREIIANQIANNLINRMGPAFIQRLHDETGNRISVIVKAYIIARDVFDSKDIWQQIENLDGKIPAKEQYRMYIDSTNLLKHATRWMAQEINEQTDIQASIDKFKDGVSELYIHFHKNLDKSQKKRFKKYRDHISSLGLNDRVAKRITSNSFMQTALDIVSVALDREIEVKDVARMYYDVGEALHLNWLHQQIVKLKAKGRWQAMARNSLRDHAYELHRVITNNVLGFPVTAKKKQLTQWLGLHGERVQHLDSIIRSMRDSKGADLSGITVLIQEIANVMEPM
ncbi:MAG: NAD-glutamate dehydrogenase [Gammaproteobacteria bacterium]|nr:NAD-glutamate dehydrogenase [Gammaproteobacteria bacterium]NNC97992.1 NAD-glutamate dehydrogenase [Gammaproteobacteria bacterium]NNM12804.1 NAD-glutamate dehydrogenase [Gammaproteobacteria bacterium]